MATGFDVNAKRKAVENIVGFGIGQLVIIFCGEAYPFGNFEPPGNANGKSILSPWAIDKAIPVGCIFIYAVDPVMVEDVCGH